MSTIVTTISLIIALGVSVSSELTSSKYSESTEICGGPDGLTNPPPQN